MPLSPLFLSCFTSYTPSCSNIFSFCLIRIYFTTVRGRIIVVYYVSVILHPRPDSI